MEKYIGVLPDNRSEKEKKKDYRTDEVVSGTVKFVTKKQAEKIAKAYIERNQKQKSSCLPSSICNALWNTEKVVLAEEPNYWLRINRFQPGSQWNDQAMLAVNRGMNERADVKELFTEWEANSIFVTGEMDDKAKAHRQLSFLWLRPQNFNDIASWLNSGYAVPFSIFANDKEWSRKQPVVLEPNLVSEKAPINHAICGIPGTAYKDKKEYGFFVTDSAHFGGFAKRDITQSFYEARMKHGIVFEDLKTEKISDKLPFKYHWTRDLQVGDEGEDVLKLQQALQWLGFFPSNRQATGKYYGITRQAVKDFQEAYRTNVLITLKLASGTGYFGASSQKQMYRLM